MESELILDNMYRDLAIHTPLNIVFKQFFSELKSVDECEQLQLSLYQVREHLIQQHQAIVDKLKSHDVTKALGFRLIQDKASSSGGHFLRWRTTLGLKKQPKGGLIWKALIDDSNISIAAKKRVTQMEKERLVLNMQMSVLNSMLKQLSEVIEKQIDIEQEYNRQTVN
ncbi:DUF3158 family protein [Conservatibacter flavescens]|uniref:DUF3158 domain-containing protein n=1 Tax=Conservatibacter flavescens TaxID=28161 RepID=A0A2M8S0V6_9PAST|nr:DUF3158 family protein [Conservatibacter flavescens]PJG84779.1 hypothetical protein CVP05_09585 [Conservatibacter flavescens]